MFLSKIILGLKVWGLSQIYLSSQVPCCCYLCDSVHKHWWCPNTRVTRYHHPLCFSCCSAFHMQRWQQTFLHSELLSWQIVARRKHLSTHDLRQAFNVTSQGTFLADW